MKLGELLEGETYRVSDRSWLDQEVLDWTDDSREVKRNGWFLAVRGQSVDGHQFIRDAVRRCASGLIVEKPADGVSPDIPQVIVPNTKRVLSLFASRWYGEPSRRLHLIAVTGTNGKTTTAFLIRHLLNKFTRAGLVGTVEARWLGKHFSTRNTTPGIRELNKILGEMVEDGISHCAMEVSSHALKQERVNGIQFASAVFTNLTQDHLDYHKTFEDYFESKARLFSDFPSVTKHFINADDAYGQEIWKRIGRGRKTSYGIHRDADYRACDIQSGIEGTEFTLKVQVLGKGYKVKSGLLCLHNVYNLLGALAVASEIGYPMEGLLEAASDFEGVPGRLERFHHPNGALIFVDYAHSPDAFLNIYGSLAPLKRGRLISVFGCGGNRDRTKRPQMGRIAGEFSDRVIVTSDNPREENPGDIIQEILEGIKRKEGLEVIEDRRLAIGHALEIARAEDMVLILGKGHEDYQIIGKEKHKFSDQEEVRLWAKQSGLPHLSKNSVGV